MKPEDLLNDKYFLKLKSSSKKCFDATDEEENEIQIKVTQRSKVGMRHKPQKFISFKIKQRKFRI